MTQELIIHIGTLETLAIITTVAGTLISIAWFASGRLTRVETLVEGLDRRITNIEGNFNGAFTQQSPIALTEKGRMYLEGSGLKEYIDETKDELRRLAVTEPDELETSYDIQNTAFDFFDSVLFDDSFEKVLKQYAYEQGISMNVLRRVAGIYFRDILLKETENTM